MRDKRQKTDVPLLVACLVCFVIAVVSMYVGLIIGEWRNGL